MSASKRRGTSAESALVLKACGVCGSPRPKGRTRYCGDECGSLATATRTREKDTKRLAACQRCQGPKEPGVRGGKYCAECRRVIGDSSAQREHERGRRRWLSELDRRDGEGRRVRRRVVDAPEGQKWCARCQSFRLLSSFPARRDASSGAGAYCIPCQRAYNQERRTKLVYGLTWDEYEAILDSQGGRCAICDGKPRKHALSVDHDHKTGEIRGLLCSRCNHKLLGSANDDPARLRRAADYLEAYAPRKVLGGPRLVPGSDA